MKHLINDIVKTIIQFSNKGTTPISFVSETVPSLLKKSTVDKTPNPYIGNILKISFVGGLIGTNYENSVNSQLGREGKEKDFVVQERKWGVRDSEHRFLIRHTKKGETQERFYLSVKPQQTHRKPIYVHKDTRQVIPTENLHPFLSKSKKPLTQVNVDKEIMERDYEISNLKSISIGGKKFSFGGDSLDITIFKVNGETVKVNESETVMV
jgi:hypothetical protein